MYKHQKNRLICLQKNYKFLIPQTTHRKAILLIAFGSDYTAKIAEQEAVPSVIGPAP